MSFVLKMLQIVITYTCAKEKAVPSILADFSLLVTILKENYDDAIVLK